MKLIEPHPYLPEVDMTVKYTGVTIQNPPWYIRFLLRFQRPIKAKWNDVEITVKYLFGRTYVVEIDYQDLIDSYRDELPL